MIVMPQRMLLSAESVGEQCYGPWKFVETKFAFGYLCENAGEEALGIIVTRVVLT